MSERKYSVAEIDAMRATLRDRNPPMGFITSFNGGYSGPDPTNEVRWARAEDQLRTYMLAGIAPDEL